MKPVKFEVKVWKEGNQFIVRNDAYHINTFGDNLDEALENFQEALHLVLEDLPEFKSLQKTAKALQFA